MKTASLVWLLARIAIVGGSLLSGTSFVQMPGDFSTPSPGFALVLVAACAAGTCVVWGLQTINPAGRAAWVRPSWLANPFVPVLRPLDVFHLAGWSAMASGTSALYLGLLQSPRTWAGELPLCVGVGVWIGVRLVAALVRSDGTR